ncbi:MAG: DUF368 domain-containing protein [Bradymonadales bacterium]|jgi:putative membrane protein
MGFKERSLLFFKGMCMGSADVVPGVSGGTVALLLGIYERFIAALRSLDLRWLKPLGNCFLRGFRRDARQLLHESLKSMDFYWLLTLFLGIAFAFSVASVFLPLAMERQPEITRAFFFGLVLASISAPYRMISKYGVRELGLTLLFSIIFYGLLGSQFAVPLWSYSYVVGGEGELLADILRRESNFYPPFELCMQPENLALCTAANGGSDFSRATVSGLKLAAGSELWLWSPQAWYIVICGFIAICAMILPGISGSFLLLVLGLYYFVLSSVKRLVAGLSGGELLAADILSILLFVGGVILGLVLFSRLLHWLLRRAHDVILSIIMGTMLGSLRSIWPFKVQDFASKGAAINILPPLKSALSYVAVFAILVGIAVVVAVQYFATKRKESNALEGKNNI